MKESINTIMERHKGNPFKVVWKNYMAGIITAREVQKKVGEWQLERIQRYKYQSIPPIPKGKKSLQGWLVACNKIKYENISHKHWLKILLDKIDAGIIEAEQGKIEEIGEILAEYPRKRRKL